MKESIVKRLIAIRLTKGITMTEMAKRLGVTKQAISQFESGQIDSDKLIVGYAYELVHLNRKMIHKPGTPDEQIWYDIIMYRIRKG